MTDRVQEERQEQARQIAMRQHRERTSAEEERDQALAKREFLTAEEKRALLALIELAPETMRGLKVLSARQKLEESLR